jgi:hypothetical protein
VAIVVIVAIGREFLIVRRFLGHPGDASFLKSRKGENILLLDFRCKW